MASSTNKRASGRDVTGFGRKEFQNPPMLPSDPPGTRRQQQLQSGLGGQMVVDKNWDYISGANTLGGGKYQSYDCIVSCKNNKLQIIQKIILKIEKLNK
jgi:hypothetical protein